MGPNYYFVGKTGNQVGPLSLDEIRKSEITKETLVWHDGMTHWLPAKDLAELRDCFTTVKSSSNIVNIILVLYAALGSVILLLVGRFIFAFMASWGNTYPYVPSMIILVAGLLALVFFLFYKKRKYIRNAILILLPFLVSSLFSTFYYSSISHAYSYRYGRCVIEKHSGTGVLNRFGFELIPCIYDNLAPNNYWSPSFYRAAYARKEGILSLDGTEIIPFMYSDIDEWGPFHFLVKSGKLRGLYTTDGVEILPCEFTSISNWRQTSLIHVEIDDIEGLYTEDGEEVLDCRYIICKEQENGTSLINLGGYVNDNNKVKNGKWGMINKHGKVIVPCKYDDISSYSSSGYVKAQLGNLYEYYDFNGNYLRSEYKW